MKKLIATLVMGLLLAFTVIGVSAQNDMTRQNDNMSGQKRMMKRHHRHHRKMMKKRHHHHHRMMMKKSM